MFLVPVTRSASDLARSFDRLFVDGFERFFAPAAQAGTGARIPALDVSESERTYTVRLDLPGVAKDDVKVAIEGRRNHAWDVSVYNLVAAYACGLRFWPKPADVEDAPDRPKLAKPSRW